MALRPFVDLPVVQWCEGTPESMYHGTAVAYDLNRYIYWLRGFNTNSFRRYDVLGDVHQYLSAAPWNAQQGAHLIFDPFKKLFLGYSRERWNGFRILQ